MNESRFWQLIDRARLARGHFASALGTLLSELTEAELFGFQHELERQLALSDRAELAGAAYLALGTCSEQSFADFRAWLVAQGPNAFSAVLSDPDSLAELEWETSPELAELSAAAREAWLARTGSDDFLARLPDVEIDEVPYGEDDGFSLEGRPNRALLSRRYPRLAAKLEHHGAAPRARRLAPRALTDLRADDPTTRAQAREQLYRGLDHLCAADVSELVREACDATAPERPFLVRLLSDLCVPAPEHWALDGFDLEAPRLAGYFDRAPMLRERYEAMERALPALLELLADPDAPVRANAAMCVAWFTHSAARVRAALARALSGERDPRATASSLLALALQDHYLHEEASLPLIEAKLTEPAPVCDAASIALYGYGDEPSERAFAGIEGLLRERCTPVDGVPWKDGDLASLGVQALRARLPDRAPEVERLLFSLLDRACRGSHECDAAAAQALPMLLWLVRPSGAPESELDPRLARLLGLLAAKPTLATPAVWRAFGELGLPEGQGVDAALALVGGGSSVELGLPLELLQRTAIESPESTARRAAVLATELGVPPAAPELAGPAPAVARAALLVVASVLSAEQCESEPSSEHDVLAEATLAFPVLVPFFARYVALTREARQLGLLDALAGRRFVPRWSGESAPTLDDLLGSLLPALHPLGRERLLEAALDLNWRLVLQLAQSYPSRRVVLALLPRVQGSLRDLESWAPASVEAAVERDAAALAAIGAAAAQALGELPPPSDRPARRLRARVLELLAEGR